MSDRTLVSIGKPRLALLMLYCVCASAEAIEPITVHYYERKPFQYTATDGTAAGLVISPARQAFEKAGIPVTWKMTPVNRIMATLKANTGADCSSGWYKSADRESFGKFTLPIYRDLPMVGLSRADFAAPEGISARELLASPQTKLLLKQGFVYGKYLDQLIANVSRQQIHSFSGEVPSMVRLLRAGVGNVILMPQEEAEMYIAQTESGSKEFRILKFRDAPAMDLRHIMCSKQVPEEVISKLNVAIKAIPLESRQPR